MADSDVFGGYNPFDDIPARDEAGVTSEPAGKLALQPSTEAASVRPSEENGATAVRIPSQQPGYPRRSRQRQSRPTIEEEPQRQPPPEEPIRRERVDRTVHIHPEYLDMARRVAKWNPDYTIDDFAEQAFEMLYRHLVKRRGSEYPPCDGPLKKGRPVR